MQPWVAEAWYQFLGDVHGEGNQPCPAPRPHQWRQKRRRAMCTSASAALPSSTTPATTAASGTLLALLLSCLCSERPHTTLPAGGRFSWWRRCAFRPGSGGRGGTGSACCVSGTGFMLVRGVVRVACGSKGRAARCVEQRRCPPGSDEGLPCCASPTKPWTCSLITMCTCVQPIRAVDANPSSQPPLSALSWLLTCP